MSQLCNPAYVAGLLAGVMQIAFLVPTQRIVAMTWLQRVFYGLLNDFSEKCRFSGENEERATFVTGTHKTK
jgi:hypothetical protein